jgi:signal transduction histidine kinase
MTCGPQVSSSPVSSPAATVAGFIPRHLGAHLLERARAGSHLVQFYNTILTTTRLEERGRLAALSVRNYSPAIDEHSLALLFEPFRGARKPVGRSAGLGLGLCLCSRIVQAPGGKIHVESSEGNGALFGATFERDL